MIYEAIHRTSRLTFYNIESNSWELCLQSQSTVNFPGREPSFFFLGSHG